MWLCAPKMRAAIMRKLGSLTAIRTRETAENGDIYRGYTVKNTRISNLKYAAAPLALGLALISTPSFAQSLYVVPP